MPARAPMSVLIAAVWLCACGDRGHRPPEPLVLPHWRECFENFGADVDTLYEAFEQGDPDAILCRLALDEGRGLRGFELHQLYRLYRIRGREPEGLDELVRELDRSTLAARLDYFHADNPELEPFESDFRGCARFDPVARELLMRTEPGGDMHCVPRRRWFW